MGEDRREGNKERAGQAGEVEQGRWEERGD